VSVFILPTKNKTVQKNRIGVPVRPAFIMMTTTMMS
jgi:hypothetical protein